MKTPNEMPPLKVKELPVIAGGSALFAIVGVGAAAFGESLLMKTCICGVLLGFYGTYRVAKRAKAGLA